MPFLTGIAVYHKRSQGLSKSCQHIVLVRTKFSSPDKVEKCSYTIAKITNFNNSTDNSFRRCFFDEKCNLVINPIIIAPNMSWAKIENFWESIWKEKICIHSFLWSCYNIFTYFRLQILNLAQSWLKSKQTRHKYNRFQSYKRFFSSFLLPLAKLHWGIFEVNLLQMNNF